MISLMTVIPALSTPVTVWSDDHLATVVCICAVNIQLQLLPLVGFNDGEQIFTLVAEQRYTAGQPVANFKSTNLTTHLSEASTSFMTVSAPMT